MVLCWGMVARDRHRGGLGRILLVERVRRLIADGTLRSIVLNTSQHSAAFFARQGFRTTRVVPDGFASGIDQHEMRLSPEEARIAFAQDRRLSPSGRST